VGQQFEIPKIGTERLVTLTDGVYAIAMTILVLELSVPTAQQVTADSSLGELLLDMWPEFLIYGLSFLILGMFWLMHHAIFDSVLHYDLPLQWINVAFLLLFALIPFSTALFGEHGATQTTALVYGLNTFGITATTWAMWAYATFRHRLVRPDLEPALIRGANLMGAAYEALLLVAIGVSFLSPPGSFIMYAFVLLGFLVATVTGHWDKATLLQRSPESATPPGIRGKAPDNE